GAREEASKLDEAQKAVLAGFLARSLRQQRAPDAQKALAESISSLATTAAIAATAVDELRRAQHGTLTAGVPIALLAINEPAEFQTIVRDWTESPDVNDLVRNAGREALGEV